MIEFGDTVKVKRYEDDEAFSALVIGTCDSGDILTILSYERDHILGPGMYKKYVGKNWAFLCLDGSRG